MSGVASMTVQNADSGDQAFAVTVRGNSPDGPIRAAGSVTLGDFRLELGVECEDFRGALAGGFAGVGRFFTGF